MGGLICLALSGEKCLFAEILKKVPCWIDCLARTRGSSNLSSEESEEYFVIDSLSRFPTDSFRKCISILLSKSALQRLEIERSHTVEGIIERSEEVL